MKYICCITFHYRFNLVGFPNEPLYEVIFFKPIFEKKIKYNDPKFNFDWPNKVKVISKKDNSVRFI